MANLLRSPTKVSHLLAIVLNGNKTAVTAVRHCGFIRDWKPGHYPKTQEEREAAAKKYNLIPEDYEPYPEGTGYGDYPNLPPVGQDARDPHEDFDYHYRRRNFGETLNINYEIYTSDRHNPNEELRYPIWAMYAFPISIFLGIYLIGLAGDYWDLRVSYPVKPKQFPKSGITHYTFEPLDN
ncbi:NADH dehydrogenase [ubiquinone] 1 beta subcomplex subunit 8, mitochondrial-like [Oppia nitens]|uniref:NADH dehydrogenase [ubiquinone] 1 beta subcomplex subunit 8, mitochondrial-like n=1 Tax=Oppia nitens TaxID=1686743 RepID=UPI0023DC014E|nr:NADH dehydrogenase [ubiquinone] 1 beta subcomplex subunit 8, mitochondrial-like [Oppia nitens]XP_054159064.1 NADH dehydrogenase [ubiquinone] 1 beta subcomplex subunit 8, mitochondrial-like [Oppia nitens]